MSMTEDIIPKPKQRHREPSAPPKKIYPDLPDDSYPPVSHSKYHRAGPPRANFEEEGGDFRLTRIDEIRAEIADEVENRRKVTKKIQKAKSALNWFGGGCAATSTILSSSALASALSGIGIVATVPLGAVAGVYGGLSLACFVGTKKIESSPSTTRF